MKEAYENGNAMVWTPGRHFGLLMLPKIVGVGPDPRLGIGVATVNGRGPKGVPEGGNAVLDREAVMELRDLCDHWLASTRRGDGTVTETTIA